MEAEWLMSSSNNSNQDQDGYPKRDMRISKRISAKLYRQDGECVPVFVGNLSRYGVQVESDIAVEIGEAINLSIDEIGEFEGVVRWKLPHFFGVHTIDTIATELLDDQN